MSLFKLGHHPMAIFLNEKVASSWKPTGTSQNGIPVQSETNWATLVPIWERERHRKNWINKYINNSELRTTLCRQGSKPVNKQSFAEELTSLQVDPLLLVRIIPCERLMRTRLWVKVHVLTSGVTGANFASCVMLLLVTGCQSYQELCLFWNKDPGAGAILSVAQVEGPSTWADLLWCQCRRL